MEDQPRPRHASTPEAHRFEPVLAAVAVIAESGIAACGMVILALTLVTVLFIGVTGSTSLVGITLTNLAVAVVGGASVALANRRSKS